MVPRSPIVPLAAAMCLAVMFAALTGCTRPRQEALIGKWKLLEVAGEEVAVEAGEAGDTTGAEDEHPVTLEFFEDGTVIWLGAAGQFRVIEEERLEITTDGSVSTYEWVVKEGRLALDPDTLAVGSSTMRFERVP